jgi:hypothetical protein
VSVRVLQCRTGARRHKALPVQCSAAHSAQSCTPEHSSAQQHSAVQCAAQLSTAQHGTAQHPRAHHSAGRGTTGGTERCRVCAALWLSRAVGALDGMPVKAPALAALRHLSDGAKVGVRACGLLVHVYSFLSGAPLPAVACAVCVWV